MAEDDDNRTARAIREGVEAARLDQQLTREAQAGRPPTFSGRTFDRDPEEVTDAAILRRLRDQPQQESTPNPSATDALPRRLLQYPGIDDTNVDDLLFLYEDRAEAKQQLRNRGCNNALAERVLGTVTIVRGRWPSEGLEIRQLSPESPTSKDIIPLSVDNSPQSVL